MTGPSLNHATGPADDLREIEELIRQVGLGNRARFEEFYERFSGLIYATAFRVINHEVEAQEVAQESLFTIWEKAPMYDPAKGKPLTWAITLTRNKAIDRVRSLQRRGRLREEAERQQRPEELLTERAPSDDLQHSEEGHILREAIGKLSPEQREAIEMVYFGGQTQQELSERLGEPLGTVKARVRRGLLRLRQILEPTP